MQSRLEICEVSPRDGLQSASQVLSAAERVAFCERLLSQGLKKLEVGSLVNPKAVPAMANSNAVFTTLAKQHPENLQNFSLLVPNARGLTEVIEIGCKSVAFFSATSETFNKKNINRSVGESLADLKILITRAREAQLRTRLYVSTVFDCAYEGTMNPQQGLTPFLDLFAHVDEVSLGDTTGRATLAQVTDLARSPFIAPFRDKLWWHFHDTFQLAAANTEFCLKEGFRLFDASAGGIGGCPFSPGAKGNIATEKVLEIANKLGIAHDYQLPTLTSPA